MRLIDADALIRDYPIRLDHYDEEHGNIHFVYGIESVMEYVDSMPTIDAVEVVRGEWIIEKTPYDNYNYRCNNCDWYETHAYPDCTAYNFCPNCGAKMKGADDE